MIPTIQSSELQTFYDAMPTRDFVVLGEMHGSKQNAPLLQKLIEVFLQKRQNVTVAFEWPLTELELEAINVYVHGGRVPDNFPIFFLDSDGRFTMEHAHLLKWMRERNSNGSVINIVTFDKIDTANNRDLEMAEILAASKNLTQDTIIVETGNLHARKSVDSNATRSMVSFLGEKFSIYSIFARYCGGEINAEGKNLDVTQFSTQQQGPHNFFDVTIEIEHSEGAPNPLNLTQIVQMLI